MEDPSYYIHSDYRQNDDIEDIYKRRELSRYTNENIHNAVKDLLDGNLNVLTIQPAINEIRKKYKFSPKYSQLLLELEESVLKHHVNAKILKRLLVTTKVRSNSGVLVVTVVTSPYPSVNGKVQKFSCKWNCYYCPQEPGQPRSYLHDEPAVLRANVNKFDPVLQFTDRVLGLYDKGHPMDKIELIVLGGTWESYPEEYRTEFIRDLFYAANIISPRQIRERKTLKEEQLINETANCKIIGLTLETRPDTINEASISSFRTYGCTRIQLGVQHVDQSILDKVHRECTTQDVKNAIRLLLNACYKVDIHIMPNLPGSCVKKDEEMFNFFLNDPNLQADQWKIYPCEIVPWTVIKKWHESGTYTPYEEHELRKLLIKVKQKIHPWIRINRVIRDIPKQYILGGVNIPNMRDEILHEMKQQGKKCRCIRCREVGLKSIDLSKFKRKTRRYFASDGTEFFISYEDETETLLGFLRLRFTPCATFRSIQNTAMIRELHVYGKLTPTFKCNFMDKSVQHSGIGTRLLKSAEFMAKIRGYKYICVIAGVGTREYYRKRGYVLKTNEEYLVKYIGHEIDTFFRILLLCAIYCILSYYPMSIK